MTDPTRPTGLAQSIKVGRCVQIGDDIRVWVSDARAGTARLVVEAPRNLPVTRPQPESETPTEGR